MGVLVQAAMHKFIEHTQDETLGDARRELAMLERNQKKSPSDRMKKRRDSVVEGVKSTLNRSGSGLGIRSGMRP